MNGVFYHVIWTNRHITFTFMGPTPPPHITEFGRHFQEIIFHLLGPINYLYEQRYY
jgi:hypothetical protein